MVFLFCFQYEYEPELEPSYKAGLLKSFKKTVDDGLFGFVIVDAVNEKEKDLRDYVDYGKSKGYEVVKSFKN